ncbi:MAG: hypothetical protein H3C62_16470 [Gemmatimonadaceae bacterium]|nr:hypothetical protein [Gemmatimonadaceae bacterium]
MLVVFVGTYNVGHVALRAWGLRAGYREGLKVASALGSPVLRTGPVHVARALAAVAGAAMPLVLWRLLAASTPSYVVALAVAAVLGLALARWQARIDGWRVGVAVLLVFFIYSVVR